MGAVIAILVYVGIGILIARLAGLIGSKIFKFSDISKFFIKLLKKTEEK